MGLLTQIVVHWVKSGNSPAVSVKGSENGQAGRHTFYRTGQSDHFRVVTPKNLVMAPDDAEQTIMVGRLDCAVTNRDGTGRSRWLTAARRWLGGGAGGSHGPAAPAACSEPGDPLYGQRDGTP